MSKLNLTPLFDSRPYGPAAVRPSGPTPGTTETRLEIDASRPRQTERPATPFRTVLSGGVSVLMTGAEVATHVVAGPVLAAAVHDARLGAMSAIAGGTGPLPAGSRAALPSTATATATSAAGAATDPTTASVDAMMQQGQLSNFQLLALQQQIQQENQQFTTVSNVMRAKHDTAKAAVSNIRA